MHMLYVTLWVLSSHTYSLPFASALFISSVFPVVIIFLSKMSGQEECQSIVWNLLTNISFWSL